MFAASKRARGSSCSLQKVCCGPSTAQDSIRQDTARDSETNCQLTRLQSTAHDWSVRRKLSPFILMASINRQCLGTRSRHWTIEHDWSRSKTQGKGTHEHWIWSLTYIVYPIQTNWLLLGLGRNCNKAISGILLMILHGWWKSLKSHPFAKD